MEKDKVITVKDGKQYLILLESELELEGYFLAVLLDDKGEPTNEYAVLQEYIKDGKPHARKVSDTFILNQLLEDFDLQYKENYE